MCAALTGAGFHRWYGYRNYARKPAEIDVMRDALQKAGFEEPMLQNFGSSHDIMVRMPPAEGETGGQVLGSPGSEGD
ncbi:hypothetical protein ACVXHA_20190 [Escherichia coli]